MESSLKTTKNFCPENAHSFPDKLYPDKVSPCTPNTAPSLQNTKKASKENFENYTQLWQANEHDTENNLCVEWHYPEGKASVSDLRLEERFGFEFKTEYIKFTPLTIRKVLANSGFQTFLNRIISPESFLLWIFLGETKSDGTSLHISGCYLEDGP